MSVTGWKFPGTMVNNRPVTGSDYDWTNADNAKADDGNSAEVELFVSDDQSSGLAASNFDFSEVPSDATINGIEVRVGDVIRDAAGTTLFTDCRLILADDSDGTETKHTPWNSFPEGPVDQTLRTFIAGGGNDVWGETLTGADVLDVDFGFFISMKSAINHPTIDVDFMQMRINYNVPTIVSGVGLPGHHPPVKSSGGAFYSVVRADADELDVYKATDPTASWTVQDSGDGPVHAGTILGYATTVDDNIIHMIVWSAAAYEYWTFDMDTDQWVTDQAIESSIDADQPWGSIAVRSDGDVVVAYAGVTDANMGDQKERVDVNIRTGSTWGGPVALDAGGDVHYGNSNIVKRAASDDMHILWHQTTNTVNDPPTSWLNSEARTLRPDDTLSAVKSLSNVTSTLFPTANLAYDSTTSEAVTSWANASAAIRHIQIDEDGSDDANSVASTVLTGNDIFVNGESGVHTFVVDANDEYHLLWSGGGISGVNKDLYYTKSDDSGATWDTPSEEINSITVNYISANIYVRSGDTVMAYVYDDGGVQKYNEKVLVTGGNTASGTPSIAKLTTSATAEIEKIATGTPNLAKPTSSGTAQRALVITDVDGDEDWADGATGLVATGEGFV
jgi:hypothetical protein